MWIFGYLASPHSDRSKSYSVHGINRLSGNGLYLRMSVQCDAKPKGWKLLRAQPAGWWSPPSVEYPQCVRDRHEETPSHCILKTTHTLLTSDPSNSNEKGRSKQSR